MKIYKVLEIFSGIGATTKALENMGIKHKTTYIEFSPKVVDIKNKLWNTNDKTKDVREFHTKEKFDIVVGGFPCQPFSMAGLGQGFNDEKGRGDLYLEALRIIKEANPDYVILENVKAITFKNHKWIIYEIEEELQKMGYFTNIQIINGKNYIPQNRERVFIMGSKKGYINPVTEKSHNLVVGDFMEKNVDESLYYKQEKIDKIVGWNHDDDPTKKGVQERCLEKMVSNHSTHTKTITTRTQPGTSSQQILLESIDIMLFAKIMGTEDLITIKNGDYHFKLSDGTTRKIGYREEQKNWLLPISRNYTNNIINTPYGILSTLTCSSPKKIIESEFPLKIRSITPRESLRLMGWEDSWIDRIIDMPKSKLYFVAGNSMIIQVMEDVLAATLGIGEYNEN